MKLHINSTYEGKSNRLRKHIILPQDYNYVLTKYNLYDN